MAVISKRRFVHWDDSFLILAGEEYCRKLYLPTGWVRLRIGVLCAINGASSFTDGAFFFGICSGKTAPVSAYNTDNFIGVSLCGSPVPLSTRSWTYATNTSWPYFGSASTGIFFRKIGQTISTASTFNVSFPAAGAGIQRRRVPFILDLTRTVGGSGLASLTAYAHFSAGAMQFDYRPEFLLDALDQQGTPTMWGQAMTATTVATLPAGDISGQLDTLCCYWSRAANPLEVYAIGALTVTDGAYGSDVSGFNDTLETYSVGTITNAGTINQGVNWPYAAAFYGTTNSARQSGYAGTSCGFPVDSLDAYPVTSVVAGTFFTAGSGWTSFGTTYGTANPSPQGAAGAYAGTTSMIYDSFESYAVGAVVSGVTVNAGLNWSTYGTNR